MSDVSSLVVGPVLDGLRSQAAISPDAFQSRVDGLAECTGYDAAEIVSEFEAIVAREKRASVEGELMKDAKGYTPSASVIALYKRGIEMAKSFSTDDSKVNFSLVIEADANGVIGFVPRFGGRRGGSSGGSGGSNVDGWTAYQRGTKKGDSFNIERVGRGEFRDVTRGEAIPQRGLIKWILTNYADSQAAAILTVAGKSA